MPKVRRPTPRETIATPEEIERLKAVSKSWMRLYITIAQNTALRRGDILRLSAANITADPAFGPGLRIEQQKTGRVVILPMTPQLAEAIDVLPPSDNPATPFLERAAGHAITAMMYGHEWAATRKRAGVRSEITGHDIRRTVAVTLYDATRDLRVVQHVLGHKSLSSTLQYLEHKDPDALRPLLAQLWTPKGPVQ